MNYDWININEIPAMNNDRIVLFGAGNGSEEFLNYLYSNKIDCKLICIVDNDTSIQCKSFHGYEIIHPDQLGTIDFDKIIITSVSGRDAILSQLENVGYEYNRDFFTVGRYPVSINASFGLIKKYYLSEHSVLEGATCLSIGPGGNLGLEVLLYCYGADVVYSIDKYQFGMNYPDITDSLNIYNTVRRFLESIINVKLRHRSLKRFDSLLTCKDNRYYLSEDKIRFFYPMDVCNLVFEDNQFDFVFSLGVLEHVKTPVDAVSEIMRVLKKGGVSLNKIITKDHRSFSESTGLHAFSYRSYSADEWNEISSRKFYQNRVLPIEWKNLFIQNDLFLSAYEIEEKIELVDAALNTFHSDFNKFSRTELGEINCIITGEKMCPC